MLAAARHVCLPPVTGGYDEIVLGGIGELDLCGRAFRRGVCSSGNGPGGMRIQSLKEMHKPYDVKTAQSLPTAERPETNAAAFEREPSARPEIIQFPGYKGPSGPSR